MWVKADKPSVKAGEVTFAVDNEGATMHGMALAPHAREGRRAGCSTRARCSAGARSSPAASPISSPPSSKPGAYELVCFLPGHYAAGQKLPFAVTR